MHGLVVPPDACAAEEAAIRGPDRRALGRRPSRCRCDLGGRAHRRTRCRQGRRAQLCSNRCAGSAAGTIASGAQVNSDQLRSPEQAESVPIRRVFLGCGPGGRGFESRRSPSSALQIAIFRETVDRRGVNGGDSFSRLAGRFGDNGRFRDRAVEPNLGDGRRDAWDRIPAAVRPLDYPTLEPTTLAAGRRSRMAPEQFQQARESHDWHRLTHAAGRLDGGRYGHELRPRVQAATGRGRESTVDGNHLDCGAGREADLSHQATRRT
jgi:hypothetical protein